MNDLSNLILTLLTIYFLAPVAAALHNDFHTRFIKFFGQVMQTNTEVTFTIFQVTMICVLLLAAIASFLSLQQSKYLKAIFLLLLAASPYAWLHLTLVLFS